MKTQKKSGSKKEIVPINVRTETEKCIVDRFWDLINLLGRQELHEKRVSDELMSIVGRLQQYSEIVSDERASIINDELESAGICPECCEPIEKIERTSKSQKIKRGKTRKSAYASRSRAR